MERKEVFKYVFSGNASADVIIEISPDENGDVIKEASSLHQILFDNLPEETYDELVRVMGAADE